jgi:tetratricopeptide (TPR) repeat protein
LKPMGTITKYYPFIDEESKTMLDSLMEESSSYYDFVQRLSAFVLENEVPVNLAYLAAVHAWWCRAEELKSLIQEKYENVPCVRPWQYPHNSVETHQLQYHDSVVEDIEKVMSSSPEDWMKMELHLLHTFYHWPLGELTSYYESLEKAKSLIDTNPRLNCFEPLICAFEGIAKLREAYVKESLAIIQRGKELAEVYDESLYKYMNMLQKGNILRTFNVQDSLALFEDLYNLAQDLEVPYFTIEVLHDSAIVYETAGEYDLAISSHLEKMKLFGITDIPEPFPSRIYSTLGDGQKALEVIERHFNCAGPFDSPLFYFWKAWALALVNKLEEAERTLDTAHSLIAKTGSEGTLGNYYHCVGVLELRRGNLLAALDIIEKAWDIAERVSSGTNQNRALLDLVRVEIALDKQSIDEIKVATPGKWLSKLEKFATERELTGIRMQAALLKSELYQNHGQLKDAQSILLDALSISDSLGVVTLRKMIKERLSDLSHLIKEAEISTDKRKSI